MTDMTVAETIRTQIGRQAFYMYGLKKNSLVGSENSLTFRLGRNRINCNCIRITLNSLDLYDIEYLAIRGVTVKEKASSSNVYSDQLNEVISSVTGLAYRL
jgi:hypothetical protein